MNRDKVRIQRLCCTFLGMTLGTLFGTVNAPPNVSAWFVWATIACLGIACLIATVVDFA